MAGMAVSTVGGVLRRLGLNRLVSEIERLRRQRMSGPQIARHLAAESFPSPESCAARGVRPLRQARRGRLDALSLLV